MPVLFAWCASAPRFDGSLMEVRAVVLGPSMKRWGPLAAVALILALAAGCALPPVQLEDRAGPGARENLARLAYNLAVGDHHAGDDRSARHMAALALELWDLAEARALAAQAGEEGFSPALLLYTAEPGMPNPRERPGRIGRALLYPLWGLPFDLVEAGLKCAVWLLVAGVRGIFEDEGFWEKPANWLLPVILILPATAGFVVGALTAFALSLPQEAVYRHGAAFRDGVDDRLQRWIEPHTRSVFVNAQRIRRTDWRVLRLREAVREQRALPLAARNAGIERWNAAIDSGPTARSDPAPADHQDALSGFGGR